MSTPGTKQTKNKRRKNKKNARGKKTRNTEVQLSKLASARIPRNLMGTAPFPNNTTRKMLFRQRILVAAAAPYFVVDYQVNNTNNTSGIATLGAIYNFYRVQHIRFRYNVAGNEPAVPLFFGCVARDVQPSTTITTWAQANNSLEIAPTTGPQLVGETSGQAIFRSKWYSINPGDILGNRLLYFSDPGYVGVPTNVPTKVLWVSFILTADLASTNLTNGAFLDFYLELTTEFFSLINLVP